MTDRINELEQSVQRLTFENERLWSIIERKDSDYKVLIDSLNRSIFKKLMLFF